MLKKEIGRDQRGTYGNLHIFNFILDEEVGEFYIEYKKEVGNLEKTEFEVTKWNLERLKKEEPNFYPKAIEMLKTLFP